ncbi:MAG: TonB-dependent receptor [Candidatus Solibacter usitatus]|nr:TonB-dependent receptor [Candidatus Solibacter usitatus]
MFKKSTFILLLLCVAALPVLAQEVSASIVGVVTDPSGAIVANAAVTARDVDRGTVWETKSNEAGIYFFPRVPPGKYEIRVEASGFKTAVRPGIGLEVNQRARLNITIEVGAIAESVEVTGEAPLLQTDSTMVGSTISANNLINAPIRSRNYIALVLLAPGVTTTDPSGFQNDRRTTGGGRPYVNGNRKEANNFLLDGIDNNQVSDNLTSYQPNLEAIAEVKMITNNASAEFGNFQGGIVNVTMKSGTNDFHGTLFEYFRNDKLNANAWSRKWNVGPDGKALPRPYVRYNAFGAAGGGPVRIPGVYNGKDKLFFFADYQAMRRPTPATISTPTVMTAEMRQGDFSRLLNLQQELGRANVQLYNPYALDASGNRQPFPGNRIPLSMASPVARNLFADTSLYPLPLTSALRFNQLSASSNVLNLDQGDIKVDAKASNKDDISVRYSHSWQVNPGFNTFPLSFNSFNDSPFKAGVVNWTRSISPSVVNEARVGVNRIVLFNGGTDKGYPDLNQKLGIAGVNSTGLLSIGLSNGVAGIGGSSNIGTQQLFANATYQYVDNLTVIRGRHLMKMGGQVLRQQMNTFYAGNNGRTGFMNFSGRFTSADPSKFSWGEADFFLGLPETIGRGLDTGTWGHRKIIWGFYFQDDWKASDTLTLNLGLRWEYHTPLVEVKDRQSNFEHFTGKLLLAGKDGNSRALYAPYKKDFQPRIGFAWTPKFVSKFVVRGAYTISSFMEGTGTNLRLPLNPPFNSEFEGRYDSPSFNLPGSTASQGLSVLTKADPYRGANIRLWDPFVRPANTQQWNLTIERQFAHELVATVGYVGQKGHHLVVPMPYFQRQLLPDGSSTPSLYLSGNPALRVITQISGTNSNGNQKYNALQSTLRKRMSGGLEFQAAYTWSKGMSDAIGYYGEGGQAGSQSAYWQYLYAQKAEWGPTYFDATHMLSLSHVWDIPIGKGKHFGTNLHPALEGIIGNWQLGGVLYLRSGFPLTIRGPDNSGTLSRGARADRIGVGGTRGEVGPNSRWFETTAYRTPLARTLGSAGNGTERGPGWKTYDISIHKRFPIRERIFFEFRAEFFNLTNTPQFNGPNRTVNSATFGEITGAQGERQGQLALKFNF